MVVFPFPFLALTLLMARVGTDHAHHAFTANDATVHANAANGTTYFHCFTLLSWSNEWLLSQKIGRLTRG
jgi:hypothetical protein